MRNFVLLVASCLLSSGLLIPSALGAEDAALKTGAAFRQALSSPAGVNWTGAPVRTALARLGTAHEVAILLDRRIDPEQTIDLNSADAPLEQALRQIASKLKTGICIFDSTIYLGPERVTDRLATLAAIAAERRKLTPLPPLTTAELQTPRELLEAWSKTTGVPVSGIEQVPHDLWPALHFPAQSAAARLSLLLAGFDLAMQLSTDGKTAQIIPLPEKVVLAKTYAGGANPDNRASLIQEKFPSVEVAVVGTQLRVTGSFEDHDAIARVLRGEKVARTEVRAGEQRFSLVVENKPAGGVVQALGSKLKMQVKFAPGTEERLGKLVSFQVDKVTLEELLKKMLSPAGLGFELKENEIHVVAKP